jgi:hypothetical protein
MYKFSQNHFPAANIGFVRVQLCLCPKDKSKSFSLCFFLSSYMPKEKNTQISIKTDSSIFIYDLVICRNRFRIFCFPFFYDDIYIIVDKTSKIRLPSHLIFNFCIILDRYSYANNRQRQVLLAPQAIQLCRYISIVGHLRDKRSSSVVCLLGKSNKKFPDHCGSETFLCDFAAEMTITCSLAHRLVNSLSRNKHPLFDGINHHHCYPVNTQSTLLISMNRAEKEEKGKFNDFPHNCLDVMMSRLEAATRK